MASVRVVTGFIDIPNHPRGAADYKALGEALLTAVAPHEALVFDNEQHTVKDTWLAKWMHGIPNLTHSIADNPDKNTMAYHCVQHEKFRWLAQAAELDTENPADMYVWIDYGILHVPGVTAAVIPPFLERVANYGGSVLMPGCWPRRPVEHATPCWRFCGGVIAVPRPLVKPFARTAMGVAVRQITETKNVEWEVNTLARMELVGSVPISWYHADHNETLFTGAP